MKKTPITTKILGYSRGGGFTVSQKRSIRELVEAIKNGQTTMTKVEEYFKAHPEEFKMAFEGHKTYKVMGEIRRLKNKSD